MSSKLEPVIWLRVLVTLAYMKGRTDVRTDVVSTDVHDVKAIKSNVLTSMGYHNFLTMVLRARAPSARTELRYDARRKRNEFVQRQFLDISALPSAFSLI